MKNTLGKITRENINDNQFSKEFLRHPKVTYVFFRFPASVTRFLLSVVGIGISLSKNIGLEPEVGTVIDKFGSQWLDVTPEKSKIETIEP